MAQLVKNLPAMQETWVRSLGWEDPFGEGKGYSLQYSGLENSMDCVVPGVAKSRTRLSGFLMVKSMEFGKEYIGSNFSSALTSCMIKASCFALVCSSAKWK